MPRNYDEQLAAMAIASIYARTHLRTGRLPARTAEEHAGPVNQRQYLKPPWMQRNVGNRIAPLFQRAMLSKLSVRGRRSGQWRTVPVAVLEYEDDRYLLSYRGESDWALNLRAAKNARLRNQGQVEEITVEEVPVPDRARLLEVYGERFGKMPTVGGVLRALPDPGDHPTFRITATRHA